MDIALSGIVVLDAKKLIHPHLETVNILVGWKLSCFEGVLLITVSTQMLYFIAHLFGYFHDGTLNMVHHFVFSLFILIYKYPGNDRCYVVVREGITIENQDLGRREFIKKKIILFWVIYFPYSFWRRVDTCWFTTDVVWDVDLYVERSVLSKLIWSSLTQQASD